MRDSCIEIAVSTYCKTELIHLAKAIAFMDLPTDPDFENESIDECLSRRLTLPAGQKILDPFPSKWHHCPMTSLSSRHLD